jgi:hypothetical protein
MTEKSLPQPSSPQQRSRTFTRYSLIWAGAAIMSLLYLVLLVTHPALVADVLGSGSETAEMNATRKAVDENVAQVRTMRDTIDLFRNELIEIRAQVSSQTDAANDLVNRVATLEAEPVDPKKVAAAEKAKVAAEKKAAAAAKKAAAAKAKPNLETGSVAQPAAGTITFGPPIVTPAVTQQAAPGTGNLIGVQIATGPSVDSLRLSWTLLKERHGSGFQSLEPRYTTDMSGAEQTYDLVVGPVASIDEARRLCQELSVKATPCTVSRFTGDAL